MDDGGNGCWGNGGNCDDEGGGGGCCECPWWLCISIGELLLFDEWLIMSLAVCDFRWLRALCKESGGKCSAGNENPAAAAACSDCNRAAECSCAFRRNSATELDLGSDVLLELVGDRDDADDVGGFIGQHEHNPGNAEKIIFIN